MLTAGLGVGPLKSFAAGFADWLARHGYTPISARFQLYVMAHLSRWLSARNLDLRALSTMDLERFSPLGAAPGTPSI